MDYPAFRRTALNMCVVLALSFSTAATGCSKPEATSSSASAAPTAAPTSPVTIAGMDAKFNGDYDHGVYVKRKTGGSTLTLARGCASFGCDSVDAYGNASDAVKKSCASASFLVADFADRGEGKAGDNPITIDVWAASGETTTLTGRTPVPKLTISDLGTDSVTGSVEFKSADGAAKGPFKAKVCPKEP